GGGGWPGGGWGGGGRGRGWGGGGGPGRGGPGRRRGPASTTTSRTPAAVSAAVSGAREMITGVNSRARSLSAGTVIRPTRSASFQIIGLETNRGQGSKTASPWFHG